VTVLSQNGQFDDITVAFRGCCAHRAPAVSSAVAPPAGFEPAPPAPEAGALSPELRGPKVAGERLSADLVSTGRRDDRQEPPHGVRSGGTVTSVTARRPKVLVVDDISVIRDLIRVNLELEGFEVITAHDGQECLARVSEVEPAVITLDVTMPRLGGFETARRLKANAATRHIPILMVTAAAQATDLRKGEAAGVDGYLTKPFDPAELVDVVTALARARDGVPD
jgi:CheY-like chemotaxis protein